MIETVKGPKPSHDRKLLPLECQLGMLIVKTQLLPPSLKCALGRWVKDVLKIWDWLPPRKLRRSSVISQSTMRGGHVYCVREKAIHSFNIDFTCAHGGGNDCKRHVESIRHKDYESLKKSQPSCLKFQKQSEVKASRTLLELKLMMCDLLVIQTCNRHNPWICWCF